MITTNTERSDPTRTTMLRRAFMAEISRRMADFAKAVRQLVEVDDAFGLGQRSPFQLNARPTTNAGQYAFLTSDKKLDAFNEWMDAQINAKVLAVGKGQTVWTAKYVESAYKQGIVRAYTDVNGKKMKQKVGFYMDSRAQFLKDSFAAPETVSKVRLLATRTFEGMRGVTAAQKSQLNRILADSIANGRSPKQAARDMVDRISGLSKSRAMTIARTEIIHAHSEGQLDAFEDLGVDELGIYAEWATAGDDRVCPQCAAREAVVYSVKEARGVIPLHPNCRCAWIPTDEKPKKKKPKATKVPSGKRVRAEDLEAAPVDRFGHRQGSQAAAINAALADGASIDDMVKTTGLSKERIASHMRHLTERGLIQKNGGQFVVVAPPPVAPTTVVPVPVAPPSQTIPTPAPLVAPLPQPIPPAPLPTAPSTPSAPSGAKFTTAEDYRKEVLRLRERQEAIKVQNAPERNAAKEESAKATTIAVDRYTKRKPLIDKKYNGGGLTPEEEIQYESLRKQENDARKLADDWNRKVLELDKKARISVQEARLLLNESDSASDAFLNRSIAKEGYEEAAKEVLSWIPKSAFSRDYHKLGDVTVAASSSSTAASFYRASEKFISMRKGARTDTFVHEFGHHLSYQVSSIMRKQTALFLNRTAGESTIPLPGMSANIRGKKDKWGKVNVYAGRIYDDGRAPEVISVGLEELWKDPVGFAEKDPEWFDMVISALKGL